MGTIVDLLPKKQPRRGYNIQEAVEQATDPFGMSGDNTAFHRPTATEVIERLRLLGFEIKPIPPKLPRLEGIEQYQVESR